jgi:hypothetical protein
MKKFAVWLALPVLASTLVWAQMSHEEATVRATHTLTMLTTSYNR